MIQVKLWLTYHFKSILGEHYFIIGRFEPYKMCFHLMTDSTLSSIRFHLATSGVGGRINLPPPPTSAHKHPLVTVHTYHPKPMYNHPVPICIHSSGTYILENSLIQSCVCVLDTELLVL